MVTIYYSFTALASLKQYHKVSGLRLVATAPTYFVCPAARCLGRAIDAA
jgi:hypothetical protein